MRQSPHDLRVLVVEDESAVLMLVEDMLHDLGFRDVTSAMGVSEALPIARTLDLGFAVLDVNLSGETSFPIAAELRARGVPFLFATGYGPAGISDEFSTSTVLRKPFRQTELAAAINGILTTIRSG